MCYVILLVYTAHTHMHTPFIVLNIVLYDECTFKNKHFILLYAIVSFYLENLTHVPQGHPQNLGSHIN